MTEKQLIEFVKLVLLDGDNPRGKEAEENLKWGFKQYLKTFSVVKDSLTTKKKEEKCCGRCVKNVDVCIYDEDE